MCSILQTLNTSSIAAIVDLLYPRLHIDPIQYLPPELTAFIFAYLPPDSLLTASMVSKAWRDRTLDSNLWKKKFLAEGWQLDTAEVRRFEQNLAKQRALKETRVRKSDALDPEHLPKKRHTIREEDAVGSPKTHPHDEEMIDVEGLTMDPSVPPPPSATTTSFMQAEPSLHAMQSVSTTTNIDKTPDTMIMSAARSDVRLNYNHVYRQRRRLEDNWFAGRYKSFQLPHKDHPEEAHSECVYTIQYSGRYLVSGSRDRTLRIWDLDTQRLIRRPLSGHNGSVLCLQFDASPEEDIVVSGSSDTDVIIWQFSTGRLLRRITAAHSESVLNVKFDKRYLVTCSKDKLIKVWNRNAMRPGDDAYPIRGVGGGAKFPSYILDLRMVYDPRDMETHFTAEQLAPVPEYSLIMVLDMHSAAVNAVYIHKDELVSASGDRNIRVYNIRTGATVSICGGHNKGIACVQYDGIRIISGSSDDSIRVFDPKSGAEVACLQGHSKLVRTVQASFGDQPGDEEELEKQARRIDREVFEARLRGEIPSGRTDWRRRRDRNAGSSRPQDVMATGAHLPPGGGGSPWARIVSGSYDELVIIWRKAKDGRWVPHHTLKQADALKAAGGPLLTNTERLDMVTRGATQQLLALQQAQQVQQVQQAQQTLAGPIAVPLGGHAPPVSLPAHLSQQPVSQVMSINYEIKADFSFSLPLHNILCIPLFLKSQVKPYQTHSMLPIMVTTQACLVRGQTQGYSNFNSTRVESLLAHKIPRSWGGILLTMMKISSIAPASLHSLSEVSYICWWKS